jgi:hypothetical protein
MKNEISIEAFRHVITDFIAYRKSNILDLEHNYLQIINSNSLFYQQSVTISISVQKFLIDSFSFIDFNRYTNIDFSQFNNVLINFVTAYTNTTKKERGTLSFLLSEFLKVDKIIQNNIENNKNTSCNFNAFRFFKIDETLHSRLLATLLNPKAEHGQGDKFLMEFLKLLEIESPEEGIWYVTAETGRIDVLLKRLFPESIIIIENKSNWAIDQQNQLYRYWHQEIYSKTQQTRVTFYEENKNKYKIIYLPPSDYKQPDSHSYLRPNDEHWINKNLPETLPLKFEIKAFNDFIVRWLEKCIMVLPKTNYRMIEYIKQYIEICKNL